MTDPASSAAPPAEARAQRRGLLDVLRLWFGFSAPVSARAYAASGVGLVGVKYGLDALLVSAVTGNFWSPLDYLNPVMSLRDRSLSPAPQELLFALAVFTLPFLWIGASMSVRRAVDAGQSAWLGLLFFVPVLNYIFMITMCFVPSREGMAWPKSDPAPVVDDMLKSALLGIAIAMGIAGVMLGLSVYVLKSYGMALFFGAPFMMGAVGSFLFNRGHPRTVGASIGVSIVSVFIAGLCILLFALEGVLCLAMAMPLAMGTAILGALIGRAIARGKGSTHAQAALALLLLPALAGADVVSRGAQEREVVSSIEIDAPPEQVWPHVVGFTELPAPPEWFFRLGIAYPQRARIVGEGVGAVRNCEFSTGPFVEPVARWEPPTRLSFDVASQPPAMTELSPYRHVAAPHLDGYLRSKRGEFRLTALPGGRTHLEGSTWYELEMTPEAYWRVWSEGLLHAIHGRVLTHIKGLSEQPVVGALP